MVFFFFKKWSKVNISLSDFPSWYHCEENLMPLAAVLAPAASLPDPLLSLSKESWVFSVFRRCMICQILLEQSRDRAITVKCKCKSLWRDIHVIRDRFPSTTSQRFLNPGQRPEIHPISTERNFDLLGSNIYFTWRTVCSEKYFQPDKKTVFTVVVDKRINMCAMCIVCPNL